MPSPAAQRRIDRLQASFRAVLEERDRAQRLDQIERLEAFGTALKLLDAAICAEDGTFNAGDERHVARLREIATARDIFAHERKAEVRADAAEKAAGGAA